MRLILGLQKDWFKFYVVKQCLGKRGQVAVSVALDWWSLPANGSLSTRHKFSPILYEIIHLFSENYGQSGIQAFRELAERANVCIAKEDSVLSNAEDDAFERVLLNLERDPNARVVVCFCEGMTVRGLLGASQRLNLTGRFLFIGR